MPKFQDEKFSEFYGSKAYREGFEKIDWSDKDCKHNGANVLRYTRFGEDGLHYHTWLCQECGAVWEDSGTEAA